MLGKYFNLWVDQIVYKLILWAEGKYPVRTKQVWVQDGLTNPDGFEVYFAVIQLPIGE